MIPRGLRRSISLHILRYMDKSNIDCVDLHVPIDCVEQQSVDATLDSHILLWSLMNAIASFLHFVFCWSYIYDVTVFPHFGFCITFELSTVVFCCIYFEELFCSCNVWQSVHLMEVCTAFLAKEPPFN